MELIIAVIIGLVSGFLGGTVGSGGMISVPALLFLGLPPQMAVATNKVGDIGAFLAASEEYLKAKKINIKFMMILAVLAIVGSFLGTQIMIKLSAEFLNNLIGFVILLSLPFVFFKKKIGLKNHKVSKLKMIIGMVIYFLLCVLGAMVGAGGATVMLIVIMFFFGFEIIEGYGTNSIPEFFIALIPAIVYFTQGFVNIPIAIALFTGCLIGGFIGSKTALKKGSVWVRSLFTVVVVASVIKILFF